MRRGQVMGTDTKRRSRPTAWCSAQQIRAPEIHWVDAMDDIKKKLLNLSVGVKKAVSGEPKAFKGQGHVLGSAQPKVRCVALRLVAPRLRIVAS